MNKSNMKCELRTFMEDFTAMHTFLYHRTLIFNIKSASIDISYFLIVFSHFFYGEISHMPKEVGVFRLYIHHAFHCMSRNNMDTTSWELSLDIETRLVWSISFYKK